MEESETYSLKIRHKLLRSTICLRGIPREEGFLDCSLQNSVTWNLRLFINVDDLYSTSPRPASGRRLASVFIHLVVLDRRFNLFSLPWREDAMEEVHVVCFESLNS
jgi:hypothetical protein